MSPRWLISVPVWGEGCVDEFCSTALPSLDRAADALAHNLGVCRGGGEVRLLVHTDQPDRIWASSSFSGPIDIRAVPAGARGFDCMSQAHREALGLALRGDVVVLLTAGSVLSEQSLVYCADVLANERLMLVLCASPRVLAAGQLPSGADAQELMDWGWEHRHPIVAEETWPMGRSRDLSRVYFQEGPLVVTRQALPHPLAARIDGRQLRFTPTVDANLMNCFEPSEMHLATECSRLAVLKLTAADRWADLTAASMRARAEGGEIVVPDPRQRWCLGHRIVLRPGSGGVSCSDGEFEAAARR